MKYKPIYIFILCVALIFCTRCTKSDDTPEPKDKHFAPLPESTLSCTFDGIKFSANPDSAFFSSSTFSNQIISLSAKDDTLELGMLLQQAVGYPFEEQLYSFSNATQCLSKNGYCASIVMTVRSVGGVVMAYGSRFKENTMNIDFEIAEAVYGGHIKGTFSGTVSTNDNEEQHIISDGEFDLYLERQ